MKTQQNYALRCIYCRKIIIEAESEPDLKKYAGNNPTMKCPHCGAVMGNPYNWRQE